MCIAMVAWHGLLRMHSLDGGPWPELAAWGVLGVTGLGCSSTATSLFFFIAGAAGLADGGLALPVLGLADPALIAVPGWAEAMLDPS